MRILLDNSNLFTGGGVQVALSFLNDLSKVDTRGNEFIIVLSFSMVDKVDRAFFSNKFTFVQLSENEQKSIVMRSRAMGKIEKQYLPDLIFTTFGPSYHKSRCPKVVGFAIPHIIYPDSPYFDSLSFIPKAKDRVMSFIKHIAFKLNSDVLIFESEEAEKRVLTKYKKQTFTVNNTLNEVFNEKMRWNTGLSQKLDSTYLNILSIAANYPHKNLNIIPQVIDELIGLGIEDFRFILTLDKDEINFESKYLSYVEFIGKVDIESVPPLYQVCEILFMPTLLEVFSTSYLEAMFMGVPIVASELPFATDVCGDAALYCEPLNPASYASAIAKLIKDKRLYNLLIERGKERIQYFGTSLDRTNKYLDILYNTINENKR